MELLLLSIEQAVASSCLLPGIVTALIIPDIAGAVEFKGRGSRERYISWFDAHFLPMYQEYLAHGIDGATMYGLRCKLLHEGLSAPCNTQVARSSTLARKKMGIAFNLGSGTSMHLCTISYPSGDGWTVLRSEKFCKEMVEAGRKWLASRLTDAAAMELLRRLVDVRTSIPGMSAVRDVLLICAEQ